MNGYITLAITGVLPAVFTIILLALDKFTGFKKIPYIAKQIIYGIIFGIIAIIGTEFGAPISGAQMNTRDAAVITAGLIFGAPAGIISGIIGGVERYIAVAWGIGTFTQVACSVSTFIAGVYSAILRMFMFDDKKPGWLIAFAVGLVMEVFHMTMVFTTNMDQTAKAMEVVRVCSAVMIPANSFAVMLSTLSAGLFSENTKAFDTKKPGITTSIQKWLLICVAGAFIMTTGFTYTLQERMAKDTATNYLSLAITDIVSEINDATNRDLIDITKRITNEIEHNSRTLDELVEAYDVSEINIIDGSAHIVKSTNSEYIGFDMTSKEQSLEFISLLDGTAKELVQDYQAISFDESIYRKYAGIAIKNGFVQVGYDAEHFQSNIASEVKNSTKNRHVGKSGYLIIADLDREIVSAPDDTFTHLDELGFGKNDLPETLFTERVNNEDCFCMYTESNGYYVVSIIPQIECYQTRNIALYYNSFMEVLVFALMFGLIYLLIKVVVINNINKINQSLDKITDGNLDEIVDVNKHLEFDILSKDINETVDSLKNYIKQANERIDAELEYAKNIQNSALPHVFPESKKYEIFALMEPAKEVGGDFYDFFKTRLNTLNFLIADVSGKGIPGAMFMMRSKTQLHSLTDTGIDVNDVFTMGNTSLCEGNDAGMFVTAWEGAIDLKTGLIKYANAGHNPPVVLRTDGTCEFVKGKVGFVLAGMEGIQYKIQELQLNPGDILFLYTDGVVEATNAEKQLYGDDRLLRCLSNIDLSVSMEYLCCEVIGDVGRFVGDAEQFDDITMMAIKYLGDNE